MPRVYLAIALLFAAALGGYLIFYSGPPAHRAERIFTIGVITAPPSLTPAWEGFQEGMRSRGFEEGKNVRYIVAPAGKNAAATAEIVKGFIAEDADLIYAMGVAAARAAKETTATLKPDLPVVFGVVSDPVGGGLVVSMQSSGNNLTGITPVNEMVVSKRLELFREAVPQIRRVIFVWNDPYTTGLENLRAAAEALDVELAAEHAADAAAAESLLNAFRFRPGDALMRATDSVAATISRKMIALALEKKIPLSGTNANDAASGALMSYGADYRKIGAQAARLASRILRQGARPSELPIELPERFELVVNLKTASALGIVVPPSVLAKADRIIR